MHLKADCQEALEVWNRDFPDHKVSEKRLTHFLLLASGLHSVRKLLKRGVPMDENDVPKLPPDVTPSPRAWARKRYAPFADADFKFVPSELPRTKGECFISELATLGPLAWGWRSPAKSGEKSKGTLRRGMLQIIHDHWSTFDSRDQIVLFLDSTDLKGKTTMDVAREYAERSGAKDGVELIARAINERIARIVPR